MVFLARGIAASAPRGTVRAQTRLALGLAPDERRPSWSAGLPRSRRDVPWTPAAAGADRPVRCPRRQETDQRPCTPAKMSIMSMSATILWQSWRDHLQKDLRAMDAGREGGVVRKVGPIVVGLTLGVALAMYLQ